MEPKHLNVAKTGTVVDENQVSDRSYVLEQSIINNEPENDQKQVPLTFRRRLKQIIWDTLDYTPEERKFVSKIDFFILQVTHLM